MSSNPDFIENLRKGVLTFDVDQVRATAEEAVRLGVDPVEAIEGGLSKGIRKVGDKFEAGEAFVTELVMAAEAMKAGIEVFRPVLVRNIFTR